jgi:hypothetical protein
MHLYDFRFERYVTYYFLRPQKIPIVPIITYLRYKCKKLSFIARTGLKYDRGTREYFKRCECNKGTFYTYVLQHFIYDREIITPVST